jgi:2-haloacid dehalogenase
MNPSIRAIIFDFGGVLLDWNPRHLYRKFFNGNHAAMESFLAEINFAEWNLRQDMGRPFSIAVKELCVQFPQYADLIKAYDQRWEESIAGTIQPTLSILEALKQEGHSLYGLSNWSAEKFRMTRSRYAFFDWFDSIIVSGEVGLVKPDPRIYALFLVRIGRTAAECLFIDDSEANVAAAGQAGFKTIRYESSSQLEMGLRQLGLLPASNSLLKG